MSASAHARHLMNGPGISTADLSQNGQQCRNRRHRTPWHGTRNDRGDMGQRDEHQQSERFPRLQIRLCSIHEARTTSKWP